MADLHADIAAVLGAESDGCIVEGDCLVVMPQMAADSMDTVITDSPYGLHFMGKEWDHGVPGAPFWQAALRVAKPGAFLLAFGGTRTFHRLTCAIEDAGWEIRDCMMWLYGSGFPKSLDISKAIDKAAWAEREATKLWRGWGTALKPAVELICVAMKPTDGTFANNALTHGVAGLNIDGGRIGRDLNDVSGWSETGSVASENFAMSGKNYARAPKVDNPGRWPANVILDEEAGAMLDEQSGECKSGAMKKAYKYTNTGFSLGAPTGNTRQIHEANSGGASRFFYCAKASKAERGEDNNHPTVKPLVLLEYLCRLTATPTGGIVLDPFTGSGSTCVAAKKLGRQYIGIEIDAGYCKIARNRLRDTERPLFTEASP